MSLKRNQYTLSCDGFAFDWGDEEEEVTSNISFNDQFEGRMNAIFQAVEASDSDIKIGIFREAFGKEMAAAIKVAKKISKLKIRMSMDGVSFAFYIFPFCPLF